MKTGYEDWDQNLQTLSKSLFPDPSKVAQGYYYGSQARQSQLESNKIVNQQNWQNRFMQSQNWGPGVPQPAAPTWNQPGNVPNAAPIVNAPANLPMSSAVVGPPGGQIVPPTMTPAQAAAGTPAMMAPYMQGTPAPVGAPSAVSPPSPQTTTSNGQQPQNDPVSGMFHPASVNSTGGGVQMSGPANADGSPAQIPFDLQKYVAMATAAGMDANQAALQGQAYATQAMLQGVLPKPLVNQVLAGTGQAAPLVADIGAAATVRGHEIGAAATIGAEKLRQAGETGRKGMDLQAVVTDPTTGATIMRPLSQMQGLGGTPSFSPDAVKVGTTPILVQPGGPGTGAYSMPTGAAQKPVPGAPGQPPQPGTPVYDATVENTRQTQLGAVQNWIDPKQPTILKPGTVEEARQNGWMAVPRDPNEWSALVAYASANAPPDQAQKIRESVLQFAATTTPKPVTAEETNREQTLLDNQLANHLPVPAGQYVKEPWWINKYPAGASPALGGVLSDLTDQYFRYDPETRGNQVTSANKAIKQLIEENRINPNQGRTTGWISDEKILNKTVLTKNGSTQVPHFRVDLLDEKGQPIKEGQPVPRIMMRRLSTAVAPGGPTGPAPRGAPPPPTGRLPGGPAAAPAAPTALPSGTVLGPATGVPDGKTGTDQQTGAKFIVRGGNYVVQ